MNGTSTIGSFKPITVEELKRVMQEIDLLPKLEDWILAAPDGRVFKGKPEELLQVLMPYHPLLKPRSIGELMKL